MTALNYAYTLVVPSSFFILFSLFLKLILCCCLGLHAFCSLDYVVVVVPLDSFCLVLMTIFLNYYCNFKGTEKSPRYWHWRALSGGDYSNGQGRSEGVERHARNQYFLLWIRTNYCKCSYLVNISYEQIPRFY